MRSPSQNIFAQVPAVNIPRSVFPRNCAYKTTLNAGYLVPVYISDVLPGDTFNLSLTAFMRLTTPIVPFMDNLMADFFFFFVPNRLVWENWQRFCGERDNPVPDYNNDTAYIVPKMTPSLNTGYAVGSLADYFGIPTDVPGLVVDAMPFRGYNLIWNEFFRDENLQNSLTVDFGDSTTDDTNYQLRRTSQRPTYFNKALPWPQKGPAVELPLGTVAPVKTDLMANYNPNPSAPLYWNYKNNDLFQPSGIPINLGIKADEASTRVFSGDTGSSTDYELAAVA